MSSLIYDPTIEITDKLSITIPTVGQILKNEQSYYSMATSLTSVPYDMMVQLDDMGVDYETINEYQLFLSVFAGLRDPSVDTSLIFGDLDLSKFELAVRDGSNDPIMYNAEKDIVIDEFVQVKIAEALRKIHLLEKSTKKAANRSAKMMMMDMMRKEQRRRARKPHNPYLENLVVVMVNQAGFPYDFESVKDLSIYALNMSFKAIRKYITYDQTMSGYFGGNIDLTKINQDELNWASL